jgi:hypothetical protein
MLATIRATRIGRAGSCLWTLLAASQIASAAAKVGDQAKLASDCGGESAFSFAAMMGQTVWNMLDACVVGRLVHVVGILIAPDSSFSAVHNVAGMIGQEVVARLVSFGIQILS